MKKTNAKRRAHTPSSPREQIEEAEECIARCVRVVADPTGATRAARVVALRNPNEEAAESPEEFVRDLLADLRHYCDAHDVDFSAADDTAQSHYLAERHTVVRRGTARQVSLASNAPPGANVPGTHPRQRGARP